MQTTQTIYNPNRVRGNWEKLSHRDNGTSYRWWDKSASHWLYVCRSQAVAVGQIKEAELGGGQDTPFEQAFSNLAHAYLKDKAPKLLDFEVGFQLLEKNQENTKAVGVFGFKVGSQWIYCPVFFLNGDLKGHELMYIKSQDMFVPLKENWIDYILGKKPSILGDGVNRNLSMLGIMPPNLYQLSRSPSKFASADGAPEGLVVEKNTHTEPDPDSDGETLVEKESITQPSIPSGMPKMAGWFREFLPNLSYLAMTPLDKEAKYVDMKGLPELLSDMGTAGLGWFIEKVGTAWPVVFNSVDRFYPGMMDKLVRDAVTAKHAAASQSILKQAVLSSAGDSLPHSWNGTMQEPTKKNGGVSSFGEEAWNKAQEGRRRSDSWVGHLNTGAHVKQGMSANCCSMPKRPKKNGNKSRRVKRASIIPSVIGPTEALPPKVKHDVVSKVMVDHDPNIIHNLSSDERKKLLKERVVFKDHRDDKDVTIAYNVQTPLQLQNPDHTGVYWVLTKPDKFEKCFIAMWPYSHKRRMEFCTVVRLDGKKRYVNTHPANVFVNGELDNDAWKEWIDKQKEPDSLPLQRKSKEGRYPDYRDRRAYILIGPRGQATCPFRAQESYEGGEDESKTYSVRFEDHESGHRPAYLPNHPSHMQWHTLSCSDHMDGEHITLTKQPGTQIILKPGYCMVPAGFKLVKVSDEDDMEETLDEPLQLGNLLDVQIALMGHTTPLRIVRNGSDVVVDDENMSKDAAVITLFRDYGLRKEAAENMVNTALDEGLCESRLVFSDYIQQCWNLTDKLAGDEDKARLADMEARQSLNEPHYRAKQSRPKVNLPSSRGVDYANDAGSSVLRGDMSIGTGGGKRVARKPLTSTIKGASDKSAADPGNDMIRGAPNAPPFPEPNVGYDPMTGGNIPTMQESEFNVKVPDMSASKTDRSTQYPFGPDSKSMQVAQSAAKTGQKEVFDTAMLSGMLKSIRQDSMVDKYMGDLAKGMDRLGRILFLYYWHGEEFEDRYGKQDMPELEDGLRNSFESVGDIFLVLKRKSVEPDADHADGDVDLGPVANQ